MQRLKAMVTAIGMLHLLVVFGSSRLQHEPAVPYAVRYALWLAQWVLLAPIGYVPAFIKPIGESPAASFFLIALNSMLWGVGAVWLLRRRRGRSSQRRPAGDTSETDECS